MSLTDAELLATYAGREVSINPWHLEALRRVADAARSDAIDALVAELKASPIVTLAGRGGAYEHIANRGVTS